MRQRLQFITVFLCFFLSVGVHAQGLVASWEAEDFAGWGYRSGSDNFPFVKSEGHSGGYYIQRVNKSNSVTYLVNVPTEGTYDLKMYYMIKANGGQIGSTIGIRVNDQVQQRTDVVEYTSEDNSIETKIHTFPVYLNPGTNKICIGRHTTLPGKESTNPTSSEEWTPYPPNFDKFELIKSDNEIEKPAVDPDHVEKIGAQTFKVLDGYTALQGMLNEPIFTITAESGNETVANLIDGNSETKFVSDNDVEIITLHFPKGSGFALRHLSIPDNAAIIATYDLQISRDGTTWEEMAAKNKMVSLFSANTGAATWEWIEGYNPEPYDVRYYRFSLKKIPGTEKMEVGELNVYGLYQGLSDLTSAENGTISSVKEGEVKVDKPSSNAIDDNVGSKFSLYDTKTLDITYAFNEYAHVVGYSLANAFGPGGRDPKSWILEASNDNVEFVELDKVEDYKWSFEKRCQDVRVLSNNKAYKYYRLTVTENSGDGMTHLGEFQLFGTLESEPGDVTTQLTNHIVDNVNIFAEDGAVVISNTSAGAVNYRIFDITGKQVKQGVFADNQERVILAKGLFIVQVSVEDGQPSAIKLHVR